MIKKAVEAHIPNRFYTFVHKPILTMTWTKKYDEFCLKQKLRPSTSVILRAILRRAKKNETCEIEIDLRVINQWIEKFRGRGYDRKTLKFALAQLDEQTQGLILIEKSYTWAIHKIIVRPLAFVLSQNDQNSGKSPKLPTGEPMFSAEHKKTAYKQQQQNISRLKSLFSEVGLRFTPDALVRVWRLALKDFDNVVDAVELLLHRHSTQIEPIPNPQGWLIECLKHGWHYESELVKQASLHVYDSISALVEDCNRLRKIPIPAA